MEIFFGGFFNKCFHCVISAQKALFRASGALLFVVDLGCGYIYVTG